MPVRPISLLLTALIMNAAHATPFSDSVGASWTFRQEQGLCLLEQQVRDFGTVRFVATPGAPLRLEVLGHRAVFAQGAVHLVKVAPPWHPDHPVREALGETGQQAGSGVLVADPLATRVLMALYDGFETRLSHAAWYGGDTAVRIAGVNLRPRYEDFARCMRNATAEGWSAVERSRIEYPSGGAGLSDAARTRLRHVAEYVLSDPGITRIYVDGHTDNQGDRFSNASLSRQRAEAVAAYLESVGVADELLVVRYHGGQYPVADNATESGRAENRRTTVRLERSWGEGDVATR